MTAIASLGHRQLKLLLQLSSPAMVLLTATPVARALEKRGLLAVTPATKHLKDQRAGAYRITPAGLRAAADALEAGLFDPFIDMGKLPR